MNLDGTTKTQVAEHVSIDSELAFGSPDGGQFVYVDGGGISVVNVDGSGTKRLVVHSGYGEYATAWSPDGRTIAFVRSTGPEGSNGEPPEGRVWLGGRGWKQSEIRRGAPGWPGSSPSSSGTNRARA